MRKPPPASAPGATPASTSGVVLARGRGGGDAGSRHGSVGDDREARDGGADRETDDRGAKGARRGGEDGGGRTDPDDVRHGTVRHGTGPARTAAALGLGTTARPPAETTWRRSASGPAAAASLYRRTAAGRRGTVGGTGPARSLPPPRPRQAGEERPRGRSSERHTRQGDEPCAWDGSRSWPRSAPSPPPGPRRERRPGDRQGRARGGGHGGGHPRPGRRHRRERHGRPGRRAEYRSRDGTTIVRVDVVEGEAMPEARTDAGSGKVPATTGRDDERDGPGEGDDGGGEKE